jgi:Na+/H+ antiporter NhaD/arsenite permease-like protein
LWAALPFVTLLLCIAIVPLIPRCEKWWEHNRNKLLLSVVLSIPVVLFYAVGHPAVGVVHGGQGAQAAPGLPVLLHVLDLAVIEDFVPFIVLLLSLFTISGGIQLHGDLRARPGVNTAFLGLGAVLASFIGTTGAAVLLIRPLLETNAQRKHVKHTVIFFIFLVCNIGGCLLPIGDPPLFLGYLRGVPFWWTISLVRPWALCTAILLVVYYLWDLRAYGRESPADLTRDRTAVKPLRLSGRINFLYLLGVIAGVAVLVPGRRLGPLTVPEHLREGALLALACLSLLTTRKAVRRANHFHFGPMAEVAALFLGIFITMQPPLEMLRVHGPSLGLAQPWQFFWASGTLSSFLDNAPTYAVFFEAASSLSHAPGGAVVALAGGQFIRADLLTAVSLGSVFMGANTYIGNGPNFMIRSIAASRGVRMPSFFGYMLYSACVLLPLFVLVTFVSFVLRWM